MVGCVNQSSKLPDGYENIFNKSEELIDLEKKQEELHRVPKDIITKYDVGQDYKTSNMHDFFVEELEEVNQ